LFLNKEITPLSRRLQSMPTPIANTPLAYRFSSMPIPKPTRAREAFFSLVRPIRVGCADKSEVGKQHSVVPLQQVEKDTAAAPGLRKVRME